MTTVLPHPFTPLLMFDATVVPPMVMERQCQNKLCRRRLVRAVWTPNGIVCGDACADRILADSSLITEEVEVWSTGDRSPRPLNRGITQQWRPAMAKKTEEQTVEAPAEAQAAPAQPKANGVTRPKPGTATGRVWEIADELSKQAGQPAARAEVLKAYEAEGGNSSTGATQYGRWRKFHGLGKYSKAAEAAAPAEDAPEVETEE